MTFIARGSGNGFPSAQSIAEIRDQINTLSRQLSTGKRASTISELGVDLSRSIDLRSRLSRLSVYDESIATTNTNFEAIINSIKSFSDVSSQIEVHTLSPATTPDSTNRNTIKTDLRRQFSQLVDYLNMEIGNRYLFGGKQTESAPVMDSNLILDGSNGKAGLTQYIAERQAADLGANGQGRLQTGSSSTLVTLSETVPNGLFGFTIKSVLSKSAGITAHSPSGTPPQAGFSVTSQPAAGETLVVTLGLPDGTTTDVTLTASGGADSHPFVIGTTLAETATNISTALQSALSATGKVELAAASAKAAAADFFKGSTTNPPRRVAGPPYDTATGFVAGTANNTVLWYQGTDDANDPRNDNVTKISDRLAIGFGARANEPGFMSTLAGTAMLAVTSFSTTDESLAKQQFSEMRDRARSFFSQSKADVVATSVSVMNSQKIAKTNSDDHKAQKSVFETALADVENVPLDQTAVSLTSVQTQLQALYQLTAKLQSLSLANYL